MRIVRYHAFGDPDVLRTEEADLPAYGPQDVLVRATAIGVDHADVQRRRGTFPLGAPTLPHCPSTDVVGTVVATGDDVQGLAPGTRVVVWKARDAYADYVAAPASRVLPVPDGIDDAEATLLGSTGRVALNLLRTAAVAAGDTVLVHAGAGAVGHIAVQAARRLGAARVIATAGSASKRDFILSLGADHAVDYTAPDWPERVTEAAGGGVDVILDGIGGKQLVTDVRLLAPYGRLVVFGGSGGDTAQPDLPVLDLLGMRSVIGFSMPAVLEHRPRQAQQAVRDLVRMVTDGSVRPAIHARIPLTEAARAHELLEQRRTTGRVVLVT
ncbi:zinc-binding alcohol dehydrogenase family protein [Streptomyces sp. NPDC053493]|uniref:zinc-binding alcohol dehydrogenase family protein n=1 Tax=Streptomyces sp. NPDC053493 TaxID=3365705 RepID=UPI0037CE96B2